MCEIYIYIYISSIKFRAHVRNTNMRACIIAVGKPFTKNGTLPTRGQLVYWIGEVGGRRVFDSWGGGRLGPVHLLLAVFLD